MIDGGLGGGWNEMGRSGMGRSGMQWNRVGAAVLGGDALLGEMGRV